MTVRKSSFIGRLAIIVTLAFLISPAVHVAHAAPVVSYLCVPTGNCSSGLSGIEVDQTNNVIYVTSDTTLFRIDGTNDTYVDSYTLSNCTGVRRPTVAHDNGVTKIYIGCRNEHTVLVLKVTGGRLGTISEVTRVSLAVTYSISNVPTTFTYEPKTERANDAVGLVYVAGDDPIDTNPFISCNDPAFAISVHTDTLAYVNATLGTPGVPVGPDCSDVENYSGINDMAFSSANNFVWWFNEDDHRVYRTTPMLTNQSASNPLANPCNEDVPQHGAVAGGLFVLAVGAESGLPCDVSGGNENGTEYSFNGNLFLPPQLFRSQTTPGFSAGVTIPIARNSEFLITSQNPDSGLPNCAISCVQVRRVEGTLDQTIPIAGSQTDASNNGPLAKVYLALDEGRSSTSNVAVVNFSP